ncbi:MAG: MFS transporter [Firmicutes bacterium]|nr:MFS transporter [Alicyclobacillaceae bacterium]MCL6496292.1 MFS transporter [Bacillota bacterium]
MQRDEWRTPDVWKIAGSAFFADLGYQAVLAIFPLFLVLSLKAPVWVYGLAMALAYGPGSLIAWWGGRVGDRVGHRRIAVLGNSLIPLLSLIGLSATPPMAVALMAGGWWARNFRTPSRRVLLVHRVQDPAAQRAAFGFLHALDVGGGVLAGLGVIALVASHWSLSAIFLLTLLPLVASTLLLTMLGPEPPPRGAGAGPTASAATPDPRVQRLLWAAGLYGFSSYNLGFPILTLAQHTRSNALGVTSYVVFLGVSALVGWLYGQRSQGRLGELGVLGYGAAAVGSAALAAAVALHGGFWALILPVAALGFALGVIETAEPALVAQWVPAPRGGGGMGALTAARSLGLFAANVVMGVLYHVTPVAAYGYAAAVAVLAAGILLSAPSRR